MRTPEEEEILNSFLEENRQELRRIENRNRLKKSAIAFSKGALITLAIAVPAFIIVCIVGAIVRSCEADAAKEKAESDARATYQAHELAQRASVRVQYGPNMTIDACWVTHGVDDVKAGGGYGTTYIYIDNWKNYKFYAEQLHVGASEKCQVWDWPGKDP
jgi:hypothetical protein